MENPFLQNTTFWGFMEYRDWLIELREKYDLASIEELLELDEYAKQNEYYNYGNSFSGDTFELALISLRSPLPSFYVLGPNRREVIDISKHLNIPGNPLAYPIIQSIAESNRNSLREILEVDTPEYKSLLQNYIKQPKHRAYQVKYVGGEYFDGDYIEFTEHPERFELVQRESKAPKIRTGGMLELERFGIYRSNFKRWITEDSGKRFLFALAFCLGLNEKLTDRLLHNEGYSYLESVHPIDKQVARAIRYGYSYSMLLRLLEHKGLKF